MEICEDREFDEIVSLVEKETIDVEIIAKNNLPKIFDDLKISCLEYLKANRFCAGTVISHFDEEQTPELFKEVHHIIIGDHKQFKHFEINFAEVRLNWFVYSFDLSSSQSENEEDDFGNEVSLASLRMLPAPDYYNLWENLIYDSDIKQSLLDYSTSALLFADRGVDQNVIGCNRVVLLHGPPGTGKTSLCRALAQKLSVRAKHRFKLAFLLEINSHSLFSKYFSESGKIVARAFSRIHEYLSNKDILVFVLIDEVESLTHARDRCKGDNEPSDAIRVVNAVLTEIDKLKSYPNLLLLTTSNLTEAIDSAFMDRADINQYIGLPEAEAIFTIYHSCIKELMRTEIIVPKIVLPSAYKSSVGGLCSKFYDYSKKLFEISQASVGLSGRILRKMPLVAHSLFLKSPTANIDEFYAAMFLAIDYYKSNKMLLKNKQTQDWDKKF